jgi:hypothetical protein
MGNKGFNRSNSRTQNIRHLFSSSAILALSFHVHMHDVWISEYSALHKSTLDKLTLWGAVNLLRFTQ